MSSNQIKYEIIAKETPTVNRNCSKCKQTTEFYCSEKFRVNANQKLVDIWLIYNCVHCEGTWNYPIFSRVHVRKFDANVLEKFRSSDKETVWHYAFQIKMLRSLCSAVNTNIKYEVKKEMLDSVSNEITMKLCCNYDFGLRIDKLLAEIMGISRSAVTKLAEDGHILLEPDMSMKSKVVDGLQVTCKKNME